MVICLHGNQFGDIVGRLMTIGPCIADVERRNLLEFLVKIRIITRLVNLQATDKTSSVEL